MEAPHMSEDTTPNWDIIRTEYVCNGMSARALGEKYGINADTIEGRARRGGWSESRRKVTAAAREESERALAKDMSKLIRESAQLDLSIAVGLKRQVKLHLEKSEAEGVPLHCVQLNALGATADKAQRIANLALGQATEISDQNISGTLAIPREVSQMSDEDLLALEKAHAVLQRMEQA